MRSAYSPLLVLALGASGCLNWGKVDDAKVPGDLLGTYDVSAKLERSTCGDGILGASDAWRFQVKLSRFENDLYWLNGREAIVGSIERDGRSFSFESGVQVPIPPEAGGDPDCTVRRDDHASGKLSNEGVNVESFEGSLTFSYRALDAASCESWLLTPDAPARLPCDIEYQMSAERSSSE